jgi:hypothetical protein
MAPAAPARREVLAALAFRKLEEEQKSLLF